MERFEIVRGLIDWNLATKIQFVLVPCENARPAAVQYNVMLLIHLCELGVNRIFVTSREDLKDNLRHYTRQAYIRIAEHLAELVGSDLAVERRPFFSRLYKARRRIARNLDHAALRFRLR